MTSAGQPQTTPAAPAEADRAGAVLYYQSDLARHRDRAASRATAAYTELREVMTGMGNRPDLSWEHQLRKIAARLAEAAAEQGAYEALRAHESLAQPAPDPAPAAAWPNAGRA